MESRRARNAADMPWFILIPACLLALLIWGLLRYEAWPVKPDAPLRRKRRRRR